MTLAPQYSFPHISFRESILGPIPIKPYWRNTIGVAGQFRRGPGKFSLEISNRQDFVYIYGDDNTPGCIFVRQAMLQGATNFVISRATPLPTPAKAVITFSNSVPTNFARVGYAGNVLQYNSNNQPVATTGLIFTAGFIGDAIERRTLGGSVRVAPAKQISNNIDFYGQGAVEFTIEEYLEKAVEIVVPTGTPNITVGTNKTLALPRLPVKLLNSSIIQFGNGAKFSLTKAYSPTEAPVTLEGTVSVAEITAGSVGYVVIDQSDVVLEATTSESDVQMMLIDKSDLNMRANCRPGRRIYPDDITVVTFDSDPASGRTNHYLEVVGYPYEYDLLRDAVWVRGKVTFPGAPPATVKVNLVEAKENQYIVSAVYISNDGSPIQHTEPTKWEHLERKHFIQDRQNYVDCFLIVPQVASELPKKHQFYFRRIDVNTKVLKLENSGIEIYFERYPETVGGAIAKVGYIEGGAFLVPYSRGITRIGKATPNGEAFPIGLSATEIVNMLKNAVLEDRILNSLFQNIEIGGDVLPVKMVMESKVTGLSANNIYYSLKRTTTGTGAGVTADDLLFNATNPIASENNYNNNAIFLRGAENGSRAASRIYYTASGQAIVRIEALSEGSYGNKIKVTLVPETKGQFTIIVYDEDATEFLGSPNIETFVLNNRNVDYISGLYLPTANSRIIRAYYIPVEQGRINNLTELDLDEVPMRIAPPFGRIIPDLNTGVPLPKCAEGYIGQNYLVNLYLEGGYDAERFETNRTTVRESDMLHALARLENDDIAILVAAGVNVTDSNYGNVQNELVRQVRAATTLTGLRIAVMQAPPNLSPSQAEVSAALYSDPRVVIVGGHGTFNGINRQFNRVPVIGAYCGILAANPPHISPASIYGGVPNGFLSVDTPGNPNYLDKITGARVDVLYYDRGLKVYKFLNGLSTSANYHDKYICIRRMADQIIMDLYRNLLWARSWPNTPDLWKRVSAACDAYLHGLLREERIFRYRPTICNESNNTVTTISQGELHVRITWTPIYPADFIKVHMVRDLTESFDAFGTSLTSIVN